MRSGTRRATTASDESPDPPCRHQHIQLGEQLAKSDRTFGDRVRIRRNEREDAPKLNEFPSGAGLSASPLRV